MTTGNLYPSSNNNNNNVATSSNNNNNGINNSSNNVTRSGQLKRSQTVFETTKRARNFPWLAVWTLVTNCITLGITIIFIGIFWKKSCATSLTFLFLYCFIFLVNIFFGYFYHLKFTRNIELPKRKNNILLSSFIIFICISVTLFIITIFLNDAGSCSPSLPLLIRANSIIDLIFLGGLLFFNIVTMCSFSADKRRRAENENQRFDLEKPSDNYQSKDSISNYPLPPPPLYLMEQSIGTRDQSYSGLPPPSSSSSSQLQHPQYINNNQQLQSTADGLPPPPPYPGNN